MLAGNYQVVDVLLLVGNVAPIALYFLFLGLVNSHSRPYLITSRSDFISLTIVLVPLLLWPVPMFVQSGLWWMLALGVAMAGAVFFWLLPPAHAGFVAYNIAEAPCQRMLEDAVVALRWPGRWVGRAWHADDGRLSIHVRGFALLRNVTIHIDADGRETRDRIAALQQELERRMRTVSQLPSTMGACLVLLGLGLMIIPMWMVSRHIDDLVDAMSHLFG